MDGIFRPTPLHPFPDSALHVPERVKEAPNSHQAIEKQHVDPVDKDGKNGRGQQEEESGKKREAHLNPDLKAALSRQFQLNLEPEGAYRFEFNPLNQSFELIDTLTQEILLSLPPDTFMELTQHMTLSSGLMTDRSA